MHLYYYTTKRGRRARALPSGLASLAPDALPLWVPRFFPPTGSRGGVAGLPVAPASSLPLPRRRAARRHLPAATPLLANGAMPPAPVLLPWMGAVEAPSSPSLRRDATTSSRLRPRGSARARPRVAVGGPCRAFLATNSCCHARLPVPRGWRLAPPCAEASRRGPARARTFTGVEPLRPCPPARAAASSQARGLALPPPTTS
ncbi:hypothetical protein BS78_K202000 [Paspalum vaginatum]|uniref:Uncharacterized protein n=1 Tax=Paspalum vaginatum TaxID=158149 RepID=A0A9W7X8W1_9POAL|nr:hypothetical protein BS78_K202000 [Paspalum vaginatum]